MLAHPAIIINRTTIIKRIAARDRFLMESTYV
jgi:hypothetical protein